MLRVIRVYHIDGDSKVVFVVMASQVARTISNMQQQIQQHQRQLAQALLMKQQQQQPPPSHSGLHPSGAKSTLDSFPGHPQAPGFPDMQTKEPQSSPNTYSPYSLGEECLKSSFEAVAPYDWHRLRWERVCVRSWNEPKHECKLYGGGRSGDEGAPPASVPPVTVDSPSLHGKPFRKFLSSRAQPGQAW